MLFTYWLEYLPIRIIFDPISKREVQSVVPSLIGPHVLQVSCTREVLPVLVERDSHHSVRCVESFLHSVPVMDVNVHV